jgi:hypothetical protein
MCKAQHWQLGEGVEVEYESTHARHSERDPHLGQAVLVYRENSLQLARARLLSFWKMSPEQALAFSKQKILRFWGLTGQRGWARLILDRLHDLVLSPDDSKGSKN